jgi:hypothetical protein
MSKFTLNNINQEVVTFYVKAKTSLICPDIELDKYEIENNKLVLSVSFSYGLVGAEGTIAVGVPPSNVDIDAFELSRKAGEWDWYSIYSFNIHPIKNKNFMFQVFNQYNTFFEETPLEIVHEFNLDKYKDVNKNLLLSDFMNWDEIEDEAIHSHTVDEFIKILKIEFEAELIDKPLDQI